MSCVFTHLYTAPVIAFIWLVRSDKPHGLLAWHLCALWLCIEILHNLLACQPVQDGFHCMVLIAPIPPIQKRKRYNYAKHAQWKELLIDCDHTKLSPVGVLESVFAVWLRMYVESIGFSWGYASEGPWPQLTSDDGLGGCLYCLCKPCVISMPPEFLVGREPPHLRNVEKRYNLYRNFWSCGDILCTWAKSRQLHLFSTSGRSYLNVSWR